MVQIADVFQYEIGQLFIIYVENVYAACLDFLR